MPDYIGKIIEYLDKNELKRAWVAQQSGEKLQVLSLHGRREKCAQKSVLLAFPGGIAEAKFGERSRQLDAEVEAKRREVDLELIWEFAREDSRDYALDELAELLFGEVDATGRAALWRELIVDSCYFKRKGQLFQPRPASQVDNLRLAESKRRENEAMREMLASWFDEVLRSGAAPGTIEVPPALEPHVEALYAFLFKNGQGDASRVLMESRAEEAAREAAHAILVRVGRLPATFDRFLALAGIEIDVSSAAAGRALELEAIDDWTGREDFTAALTFSIDDAETREVDDAFSFEATDDGCRVGIHIADVCAFCEKGDSIDREAAQRGVTAYLPSGSVTMLPERLGCDLASLNRGVKRPAVSLIVDFSFTGEVDAWHFARTVIELDARLTYDEVEAVLADADAPSTSEVDADDLRRSTSCALRRLYPVALMQQSLRQQTGALLLERKELSLKVDGDDVRLTILDPGSPSNILVREFMILYSRQVAELACENQVPIIYRGQDAPDTELPEPATTGYDPIHAESVFRLMKASKLSLEPQRHSSLGLDAYTQATSPLRRYADLSIQRQLVAHLEGRELPYGLDELYQISVIADGITRERAALERRAKRYWSLVYLDRYHRNDTFDALVVRQDRGDDIVEIDGLFVRGPLAGRDNDVGLGDRLRVRIGSIDARNDWLRFQVAR